MRRSNTQKITLCGVFGGLALAVLLGGDLIPLAVYVCPALAGMLILPVVCETDRKTGLLFYAGISLLGLLILPDREPAVLFIAFLGYYPLLKLSLDRIRPKALGLFCKLLLFNVTISGAYWLMLHLFGFDALADDFAGATKAFELALLAAGNVTFLIYDLAAARLYALYCNVLRPRILNLKK